MQKILRRVATAERAVAKRKKLREMKSRRREYKAAETQNQQQVHMALQEVQGAKQAIKDDWALGPLSPRQDVGEWEGARGAIGDTRFSGPSLHLPLAVRNARCEWAGGAYYLNLAIGDRVVLLDGPDKGRIGKVIDLNHDKAEVTVKDLNKTNIRVMPHLRVKDTDPRAANMELPLPISAVRLIYPITSPDGTTRDVVINRLVHKDLITDRITGKRRWQRVVPGLNISIPWPEKEKPDLRTFKGDTLRIDVEERTFIPTLLRPPMPEAIIDELRGKYSRFRTRHEPEYIARLEAEEQAKKDRAKLMESMRTPLQEFHREERKNKKRKGKPRLTLEMLEKIGEVIARNRERTLNAAGLSNAEAALLEAAATEVPPTTTTTTTSAEAEAELASTPPPTSAEAEPESPPASSV